MNEIDTKKQDLNLAYKVNDWLTLENEQSTLKGT